MFGMKRFAAKAVVLTTVLASGGAGTYYATTNGEWSEFFGKRAKGTTSKLVADEARELTDADLDAVASSWATAERESPPGETQSAPTNPTIAATSIPIETTAPAPAAAPAGDRYGLGTVAAAPTSETEQQSADPYEPTPVLASVSDNASEEDGPQPVPALARGQEPNDDDKAGAEIPDFSIPSGTAAPATEPQALELPSNPTERNVGAERARDAFREEPTLKTSTSPAGPASGSRYATAPAARAGDAKPGAAVVNPFAPQPIAAPASNSPAEPRDLVQPIPAASENRLANPPTDLSGPAPANAARTARTPYAQPNVFQDGGEPQRSDIAPNSPNGFDGARGPESFDGGLAGSAEGTGKPGERALEGPQKPALLIQKIAPPELQVGKPAKFLVQVRNVGGQVAEDVAIRDEVPRGTRLVSTSPTAESNGSQLVWQLGKLSAGEEKTVEMQVLPSTEGEIGSVATVTYSAQASVKTRCTMPQLALRLTAPNEVMIGAEQRVKIELRNPGSGDATGVMLFENVPQNLRHAAGPALEFEIGTLRPGETRELELMLKAEKAGKVVNVLTARADGNLQVQQQVEFEVIAPALSVEVNGPERRYLERPATYEVIVANPGTAAAHDVQLVTKLPKGMRFVRANNMGEYDASSHSVYWSLAELPEGERGAVELVAMPIETGPQTLEVQGRAQQGLSDQKQQQIIVEGLAAIMFEVRDLEDPIEVGGETGYEIRVVNQGTKAATNVRVAINLPPGMQAISAEGETRHTAQGSNISFEPLAQLAPKADTVFRVKAQGVQAGDQRVTVEVNTDDLGQPIRREESTRVFGDE